MASTSSFKVIATTNELVSLPAFHAIVWIGFALCVVAFGVRLYIRCACFHRPLVDDYLMIAALALLLANTVEDQLYLKYIYNLEDVSNGVTPPESDFLAETQKGIRNFGTASLFCYIGIWLIKLNFIFFFRRLGTQLRGYFIFWWAVLGVTIACGAVSIGLVQFQCLFGPIENIVTSCVMPSTMERTYNFFKVSCIVDVISDALIICFPVSILWRIPVSTRKKITLAALFSLVAFTIAVTIVRGSIFGGVYKPIDYSDKKEMNVTWIWFWFSIEFTVSFIIACIVSFRALFTQKSNKIEAKAREDRELRLREAQSSQNAPNKGRAFIKKASRFHDSLLDTLRSTERDDVDVGDAILPIPPSHKLDLDFSQGSPISTSMVTTNVQDSTTKVNSTDGADQV